MDTEDDDQRTCSICFNTEDTSTHPSLLHHTYKTNCKNVTHKDCLYNWIDYAISSKNPTAFQCSKCRKELPVGMLLAAANGEFDNVSILFYKYKKQLDLSNADFKTLLDSIPQMLASTKKKIISYVRQKEEEELLPPTTPRGHQIHVIADLNNPNTELHNIFYTHLRKIIFSLYTKDREGELEFRQNINYLYGVTHYYTAANGRRIRITDQENEMLKQVFAEKINEFFRNNATTIKFNANVVLYPYRRMQDEINGKPQEPYNTIRIEDTIELNTELQSFYNNALQQHGIYEPRRIGQPPFPVQITGYDYVSQRILNNGFLFLNQGNAITEIYFYDKLEIIPTTTQEAYPEPPCQGNTCNIMGGSGKSKSKRKSKRRGTQRTKRFYRR